MQHHGSHAKYTEAIRKRIKIWMEDNKNYTPEDAKDSKTYRVVNRDGSPKIKPHGGYNRINGKTYMEVIFFHRTNWSGKATSSSQGCLIIDARFWRQVEQQLGTSSNIYLLLNRQ